MKEEGRSDCGGARRAVCVGIAAEKTLFLCLWDVPEDESALILPELQMEQLLRPFQSR